MENSPGFDPDPAETVQVPGQISGIAIRKTMCTICSARCAIDAYVKDGVVVKVEGSKENPFSNGTLCSKGAATRQYIYHKDRLLSPLMRDEAGKLAPTNWNDALDRIGQRLNKIKQESGPESVAFFVGYSKWMRPFVKRLAHSFGSPNYLTESSTCHEATAMANKLTYGAFGTPEIRKTRCLLVWSKNPFYSNTPTVSRLLDARDRGLKIIEVGPLLTPLSKHADIHLRIRPGTSGALAHGMARVIVEENLHDREFVDQWTAGFAEYRNYIQDFTPSVVEDITGVPAELIIKAARLFATTKPASLLNSSSATVHHTNGVQNHRALIALVGLTGNFDCEGGNHVVPAGFLNTPNGLVTRQAEFQQSRPWEQMAPRVGQEKFPVWCRIVPQAQAMRLPHQILSRKPYPIRAIVAFGLNYRMWPGSDFMYESLKKLDFFVNVDLFRTDSTQLADVVLPACSTFERQELKFYPGKYVIYTQPVIDPLGNSRSDTDIVTELAHRLAPDDALLNKGYEDCLDWILEPTGLSIAELKKYPGGYNVEDIPMHPYRKYKTLGFATPSGKMEFSSTLLKEAGIDPLPTFTEPKLSHVSTPSLAEDFPLILTTGARLPMFFHSRTFRLSWTRKLRPDPMVDMNPRDATKRKIRQGDRVTLSTPRKSIEVRANLTEMVAPGVVNMYHGYPEANVNELIDPEYLDPISGFPGFKSLVCQLQRC
jgi:anaerobic selenocysteine-containing dehydrogenase